MQMQPSAITAADSFLTVREGYYLGAPLGSRGSGELTLIDFSRGLVAAQLPLTKAEWLRLNAAPYLLWYTLHELPLFGGGLQSFMLMRGRPAQCPQYHSFAPAAATRGSV